MKKQFITILFALILLTSLAAIGLLSATVSAENSIIASGTSGDNLTWALDSEGTLTFSGMDEISSSSPPWYSNRSSIKSIFAVYSYTEELNYEGTDYVSYSQHPYSWEDCSVDRVQCEHDGFAGSKCTVCELMKGNTTSAHDYTPHSGNDLEYHCDICEACGAIDNKVCHSWTDATCTTPKTCSICSAANGFALGHNFVTYTSNNDATCTEDGTKTSKCTRCNATDKVFDIDTKLGHDMSSATCTEASKCQRDGCDHTVGTALGHSYDSVVTAPTATADGFATYTCIVCSDSYTETITPIEFTITSTNRSQIGYTGNGRENLIIPAVFENSGIWYRVTSIGDDAFSCCIRLRRVEIPDSVVTIGNGAFSFCDSLYSVNIGCGVTDIGAEAFYYCLFLKYVELGDNVENIGDYAFAYCCNFTTVKIPVSVTTIGEGAFGFADELEAVYYHGDRAAWNNIFIKRYNEFTDSIMFFGHIFDNYVSNNDATCILDGTKTAKCELCDVTDTIINKGSAFGHSWTSATCTSPKTCSVCNITEGSALGHTWESATCTAPKTCSVCSETEGSALGHSWNGGVVTKEPTSEETGIRLYTCTTCGEQKTDEIPVITYIVGDIDGNEDITSSDAVYLLMYTFFPEDYPVSQESDFNADGEVNSADAVYLLMYTFFPEDYPLEHESTPALLSFRKREDNK